MVGIKIGGNMETKVMFCVCKHKYQDERYGKGKRLHNWASKDWKQGLAKNYRCTVCGIKKQG